MTGSFALFRVTRQDSGSGESARLAIPRMLDEALYYATAPIRLFGRSRMFRLAKRPAT